jgi:hypothetical protein
MYSDQEIPNRPIHRGRTPGLFTRGRRAGFRPVTGEERQDARPMMSCTENPQSWSHNPFAKGAGRWRPAPAVRPKPPILIGGYLESWGSVC